MSTTPPKGFRDLVGADASLRQWMMRTISDVYAAHGFAPIHTSAVENLHILQGKDAGENENIMFKLLKRGEKLSGLLTSGKAPSEDDLADLGLRFDLTVPLSRLVSEYRGKVPMPWKVFHIGTVWRGERPQKGRFREFTQADADIIGAAGIGAEVEVLQAGVRAVEALGGREFDLRINDRRILRAVMTASGVAPEKAGAFLVLLDKKDKIEVADLRAQAEEMLATKIPTLLSKMIDGSFTLDDAKTVQPQAAQDLQTLLELLKGLHLPLARFGFDPSLARGLGYYTGPVFELRHSTAGYSFGGGGRYDELIGKFSNQSYPAVGFSIGFDRMMGLLQEQGKIVDERDKTIFMPVFDEALRGSMLDLAAELRRRGLYVDVYADRAKLGKQMKYADEHGYRWVILMGEDEQKAGRVKLKDFRAGTERDLTLTELKNWQAT